MQDRLPDIPPIGEVKRLELKPTDTIVVRYEGHIPPQAQAYIKRVLEDRFPGHTVLVLEQGLDIEIISK